MISCWGKTIGRARAEQPVKSVVITFIYAFVLGNKSMDHSPLLLGLFINVAHPSNDMLLKLNANNSFPFTSNVVKRREMI